MPTDTYDIVLLGVGSGAKVLAQPLARSGKKLAAVEHRKLGGECPYYACMPSKFMLRDAASGRTWPEAVLRRDDHTQHADDSGVEEDFVGDGIDVLRGHGVLTGPHTMAVEGTEIGFDQIVIDTGTSVVWPPIDGLPDVPTWDSEDALTATQRPASLIVLGGGPIGVELAQVFARLGTDVTLVESADRLAPHEAPVVGDLLATILHADHVDLRTGIAAERAEPVDDGARLHLSDGSTVEAERVLVAVGRAPSVAGLGLEHLGIDVEAAATGLAVDGACRVIGANGAALQGVWAVGDVTGIAAFTHVANYHGRIVVDTMLGRTRAADYTAIPRGIYTFPAAFGVGMTPDQAREQGIDLVTARGDLNNVSRSHAEGASPLGPDGVAGGCVELYADRATGLLVGAAGVATEVDSWLGEVGLAIRAKVPVAVYNDMVHAFPTWSEALDLPLREIARELAGVTDAEVQL